MDEKKSVKVFLGVEDEAASPLVLAAVLLLDSLLSDVVEAEQKVEQNLSTVCEKKTDLGVRETVKVLHRLPLCCFPCILFYSAQN